MKCWCHWRCCWRAVAYRPKCAMNYLRARRWWSTRNIYLWRLLSFAALLNGSENFHVAIRLSDQIKVNTLKLLKSLHLKHFSYLSKSKSHLLRTSSRTDRLRCGNSDDNISIAFCETSGDFEVDETEVVSWDFLLVSSVDLRSINIELESSGLGSVTVIPNIFPGGSESIAFPLSLDASRNAIASSTACWRFKATWKLNRRKIFGLLFMILVTDF